MMLDTSILLELPVRLALEEDSGCLNLNQDGLSLTGKARIDLNVMRGDHMYYCNGQAVCDADMECSRCLEPYRVTLQGEVEFSIREDLDGQDINLDDLPENELVVPSNASEIDITSPVREALLLSLPLKPLCREDCKGLCPICGANRNEQKCECTVDKTDSRWDGLRDLLK